VGYPIGRRLKPDITIAVRMDAANETVRDYYLLPGIDMTWNTCASPRRMASISIVTDSKRSIISSVWLSALKFRRVA